MLCYLLQYKMNTIFQLPCIWNHVLCFLYPGSTGKSILVLSVNKAILSAPIPTVHDELFMVGSVTLMLVHPALIATSKCSQDKIQLFMLNHN